MGRYGSRDWRMMKSDLEEIAKLRDRADKAEREIARMRDTLEKALQWMADYDSPNTKEVGAGWIGVALRGGDFGLDALSLACRGAREIEAVRKKGGEA